MAYLLYMNNETIKILLLEEPKGYEFIDKFYEQIKESRSQPTPSGILRREMPMS